MAAIGAQGRPLSAVSVGGVEVGGDMTKPEFLTMMRQIGLDPGCHDVEALRAAYTRLTDLFDHLDTNAARAKAQALPVFDPREPL